MRTIDADAFADYIRRAIAEQKYESLELDKYLTVADVLEAVISELVGTSLAGFKNAPTVDTVPMAHGRWIHCEETDRFYEHWSCSVCGHDIIENPSFENFVTGERLDFLFCPYCGAKMDGKDKEHD